MARRFLYLGFLFLSSTLTGCFVPAAVMKSEEVAVDILQRKKVSSAFVEDDKVKLHYVARKAEEKTLLVFVHGTPGSWRIFSPQLNDNAFSDLASLVAIDRPGWGASRIKQGDEALSLEVQSALVGPLLPQFKQLFNADKLVLIGHSLGASLVPRIAMDFPEHVDGVIAIAGDLTEQYSAAHWYNGAASFRGVNWMLSADMKKANHEVMALDSDLASMILMWEDLQAPLLVIQGEQDKLVDPRHADFAQALKSKGGVEVIRISGEGHLVHINQSDKVNKLMIDFVRKLPSVQVH